MAKRERASLRRRSSILSVSFTASDAEQEQEEGVTRDHLQQQPSNNSSDTSGEQQHHQGLDENESQRKTRLRRSISLGTISAAGKASKRIQKRGKINVYFYIESQMRLPDFLVFDRNSSTEDQSRVLVPRADRSSLLRRGARTRFQRNSSFTPSAPRRPVDRHRQAESMPPVPFNRDIQSFEGITLSDKPLQEDHQQQPHLISRPETEKDDEHIQSLAVGDNVPTRPSSTPPITPSSSISEPTFQRQQQQQQQEQQQHEPSSTLSPSPSPSPSPPPPPPPPHSHAIDRGEKKSSWSWGFRKNKSDQLKQEPIITASSPSPSPPTAAPEPRPSVSTDSTSSSTSSKKFGLSSLFSRKGSSSKVQPANVSMVPTNAAGANGTAVPKDFQLNRINQNRLPIHIERAIYRLSHTKLANPRRPLHEQVLISNLMFWYLSVVSSTQPNGSVEAGRKFVSAGKKGKRQPQQQQQNRPASNNNNNKTSNHRPSQQQQQQQQQQNTTLHQYMGNNASTGFVIPENYLRPKGGGPKHRKPSLSDSDEDDDDDDSSSSDSSSDEETTKKAHTMTTAKKPSTRPNIKGPALINHTQGARKERDDDIPLAMYKSKGRV